MAKRHILILGICILSFCSFTAVSRAEDLGVIFNEANILYKASKYEEAIKKYETVLEKGFESGSLYYNLGNSYFKKGELGKATLNYERARQLMPNDSDLRSNYEYARSLLNLDYEKYSLSRLARLVDRLFEGFTIDFLAILLSSFYMLTLLGLILNLLVPGLRRFWMLSIFILMALLILGGISLHRKIGYLNKGAIVINKKAEARFEPNQNATAYFNLAEGSSVEVVEEAEDWYKVRRSDGKIGWVEEEKISLIQTN